MNLNLPNRLTICRVALIPVMVVLLHLAAPWCRFAACGVFLLASLTDYLDGSIARKRHLETDFGRFLDPVADKLLVLSAMTMLVAKGLLPPAVLIVLLFRELSVDGLRMVAVGKGKVIAAGWLGKVKTVSQMALIVCVLLSGVPALTFWLTLILTCWVVVITLWSGIDYFVKNLQFIKGD